MTLPKWKDLVFSKKGALQALYEAVKKELETGTTGDEALDGRIDILETSMATKSTVQHFQSEELTGTGEAQAVPHGLEAAPTAVIIALTEVGTDGADIVEGIHGTANVNLTVTAGAKFKVTALLIT